MMKSMIFFGLFVALAVAVPISDVSDTESLQDDMVVDVQVQQEFGLKTIKSRIIKPIQSWWKPKPKPLPADKDTKAYGGNGGGVVDSKCAPGAWIVSWGLRTGRYVDSIQGKCSDGKLLKKCGRDTGHSKGFVADKDGRVPVRTGGLVDNFEGHGGRGGRSAVMDCGKGYRARGYKFRCGALVDQVQLHCRRADLLDAEKKKIDAAKAAAAKAAKALKDAAKAAADKIAAAKAAAAKIAAAAKAAAAKIAKDLKDKREQREREAQEKEARLKKLEDERKKAALELKKAEEAKAAKEKEEKEKADKKAEEEAEEEDEIIEEAAKHGISQKEAIACGECVHKCVMSGFATGKMIPIRTCSHNCAKDGCTKEV